MSDRISAAEARETLEAIDLGRRVVVKEVGMPPWYWWCLAVGWIVVGVAADSGSAWVTGAATFLFGMLHAIAYGRVAGGRHRTDRVSVSAGTVGRRTSVVVLGSLLGLGAMTTVVGFLTAFDGARHPATLASVLVAVIILLGGPRLMGSLRESASRGP